MRPLVKLFDRIAVLAYRDELERITAANKCALYIEQRDATVLYRVFINYRTVCNRKIFIAALMSCPLLSAGKSDL